MILISNEAIEDIATFYANTLIAHPNTWTQDMVDEFIEETMNSMQEQVITTIQGQRTPLLQSLDDGKTAEMGIKKNGRIVWYFSVRKNEENFIIENAWHYTNASNRAYRRGVASPGAPAIIDDRRFQGRLTKKYKIESVINLGNRINRIVNEEVKKALRRYRAVL